MPNVENIELKKKINELEHYGLWVVKIPDTPVDVYGIINKDYGVLEMSTSVLCNAKKMLHALEGWETGNPPTEDMVLPEIG